MSTKSTHVIPKNGQWAVMTEGSPARNATLYDTQKEAVTAAREMVHKKLAGQIVIHGRDGSIRITASHGMLPVQNPPGKSKLGTKAIERAVSTVIRERLLAQ